MSWLGQWSEADPLHVRDALALLHDHPVDAPGSVCSVCDAVGLADQRWLFWFGQEGYQDQGMLRQFRASLGLCTAHMRRLLAMGLPWVATAVLTSVVDAALHRLRSGMADGTGVDSCLACQEQARSQGFTLTTLLDGLTDTRVQAAYQDRGGLCLQHALAAVPTADAQAARLLAATLRRRLARPDQALATLAGRPGPDTRGPDHSGPDATASRSTSTLQQLRDDLGVGVCPACLRAARMEHRYLGWLPADADRAQEAIAREGVEVCADHLHALAAVDRRSATAMAAVLAERVDGELARFETDLDSLPPTTIGRRLLAAATQRRTSRPADPAAGGPLPGAAPAMAPAAAWVEVLRPYQDAVDEARQGLLRQRRCRVCQERDATAARTIRLLAAALTDAATAAAYEASPGLCARHALAMIGAHHSNAPGADAGGNSGADPGAGVWVLVRRVAVARLGVLAWELGEAARKRAWSQRHEPPGPEADAWLRGAALVDGMTQLAGPLPQPQPAEG